MKLPNTHNATLPGKAMDSPQPATQNIALRLCQRFELYNVVCLAMIKNQDGCRWNPQTIAWKSCGLSASLSIPHFILELNQTVRDKMLCALSSILSPGRTALVMFYCHDLTCQEKLPHETDLGKLWLHIFLRCSRHNTPLNAIYLPWAGKFLQSEALGKVVPALRLAVVNQYCFFSHETMK